MNEAIKLTPIHTHPSFKDGDGGGTQNLLDTVSIEVADNGYIVSAMFNDPLFPMIREIYPTTDAALKRVRELVKA